MSKLKAFWKYWRENIKLAKERHELTVIALFFGIEVVIILAFIWTNEIKPPAEVLESKWFQRTEISLGFVFALFAFTWLPFKRHQIQLEKQLDQMSRLEDAHVREITLKDKLIEKLGEDAKETRRHDIVMAYCLKMMNERILEARRIGMYSFSDEVKEGEFKKTEEVIENIRQRLTETFGYTKAEMFSGSIPAPVNGDDLPYDIFREQALQYRWHKSILEIKRETLIKLAEAIAPKQ